MDEHLNVFCQYGKDERSSYKEDNITRASLVTFCSLTTSEKIDFFNSLVGFNILKHNVHYDFSIELQENKLSERVSALKHNKFLIGFCPSGKVQGESDLIKICKNIYCAKDDHNARPDGCILVSLKGEPIAAVVFENKFTDLYYEQLKRHFIHYMGIDDETIIKKSFIIKNYSNFFNLYKKYPNNFLCKELLEYLIISGHLPLDDYKEAKNIKYNPEKRINDLSKDVLNHLVKNGKVDYQKNWGPIIEIGKINDSINKIGLIFSETNNCITLNLRFAPTMNKAKKFYSKLNKSIVNNPIFSNATCSFAVQYIDKYEDASWITFGNKSNYLNYFINNYKNALHQYDKNGLFDFLDKLCKVCGQDFDKSTYCYGKTTLNHGHINICPGIEFRKQWNINNIPSKSVLLNEIKDFISKVENAIGFSIHL